MAVPFETDPQDISGGSTGDQLRSALGDAASTAQERANAAYESTARTGGGGTFGEPTTSPSGDPWVWRRLPSASWQTFPTQADTLSMGRVRKTADGGKVASPEEFAGEFLKRLYDDENKKFEQWVIQRAWATTGSAPLDSDGRFSIPKALDWWKNLGATIAASPGIRDDMTPEQWADSIYQQVGGDDAFQQYADASGIGTDEEQNPITTQTNVYRTKANPEVVNARADELAQALLGRMASKAELARYRKTINSFLAKNPTVQTMTTDRTDPDNVKMTSSVKEGASTADALSVLEMKMRRGSEGMAFNAGKMIEDAMMMMDRGL